MQEGRENGMRRTRERRESIRERREKNAREIQENVTEVRERNFCSFYYSKRSSTYYLYLLLCM